MSVDPFAPLNGAVAAKPRKDVARMIVLPVPADAPPPPTSHPKLGKPTARWHYRDAAGAMLGFVSRFDADDGKQFRPLTLWRAEATGALTWRWESWPAPRPLYGLTALAERPTAPVIVAEGEKACDAAARLLPDHVSVASPNGSKSADHADWSPLRGRTVVLWPDADAAGLAYAAAVTKSLQAAGALSVAVISPPEGAAVGWDAADAEAEGWTADRVEDLVNNAKPSSVAGAKSDAEADGRKSKQQREQVMKAADCELWHDADENAYASIPMNGHLEHWPVKSAQFKRWLTGIAYRETGELIGGQKLEDFVRYFEWRAIQEGPEHRAFVRVGRAGNAIYLDLADDDWRAVEVTANGWQIIAVPPVKFIRSNGMRPLPEPEAGSGVETLRRFINVRTEDEFRLVVGFMVMALRDRGPYPILIVNGEQGTGKSVVCRMIRSIIDPNAAPIRAAPKDERDMILSAINSWALVFDNMSAVPHWFSDGLCRLASGTGFATRMLHTDRDESIFEAQRPIVLNGIPMLTDRADLADRAVTIHLSVIPPEDRLPEDELWHDFDEQRPYIIGALLDGVSAGLRNLATVRLPAHTRMADFQKWVSAAEPGLAGDGWEVGQFGEAYERNRSSVADSAFEADPVAVAVREFLAAEKCDRWEGTPTELLAALNNRAPDAVRRSRAWPATAQSLGNRIERAAPLLRSHGFIIERRHSEKRTITIVPPSLGGPSDLVPF